VLRRPELGENGASPFRGIWGIEGDHEQPFSQAEDSGALVVTEDGSAAVGNIRTSFEASDLSRTPGSALGSI
jgi:hypothetical protein